MSAELLLENFDLVLKAPDSIQKLRELILQLAVQGKLVEQDPEDEPASVLLEKIKAEKERLIKEKKIKKSKPLPPIDSSEVPYGLPVGWRWVRMRDITHDWGQKVPNDNITYIDVSSINKENGIISNGIKVLTPEEAPSRARKIVKNGTVIYSTVRPYLLNIAIVDKELQPEPIASTAFSILHPFSGISNKYLYHYLRSKIFVNYVEEQMQGMAYPAINDSKMNLGLVPLPPKEEQKRIVAKVDKLMALCDNLEERQQDAYDARLKLNEASLYELLNAKDSTELDAQWQLICENFNLLYDNAENVNELRQTILQLAVQGTLVPQNPEDEPASILLEKIKAEREQLIKEKKIKKSTPLPPIGEFEAPCDLPDGWGWVRLGEICNLITDGTHHTPNYISSGVQFLSVKDISKGFLDFRDTKFISEEEHANLIKRCNPEFEDILLTKVGTTGIAKVIDTKKRFSIFVSLALLKFNKDNIYPYYLELLINSPFVKKQSERGTEGVGNKNLVLKKIKAFLIPLPPLNEQKRIVAKVDQLMALCNELEGKIEQSEELSQKLLESVVHDALAA